ncbi:MAG: hypothetical protein Q7R49_00040 [Candidatus Daviesbacteria bacterium]|nr:hypothetical protein [Candidatus Daviesbacteria bacterium]
MDNRSKFLKIYANLPMTARDEIVVIIEGKPLTWNAAYIEVENRTDLLKEILAKLIESGILK